jgi:hypothetical protein
MHLLYICIVFDDISHNKELGSNRDLWLYLGILRRWLKHLRGESRSMVLRSGVRCLNIKDSDIDKLGQHELIAVGAPTQYLTASKPMKIFLLLVILIPGIVVMLIPIVIFLKRKGEFNE